MPRAAVAAKMDHSYRSVRACLENPPGQLWIATGESAPVMRASLPAGIEIHHEVELSMGPFYELTEPIKTCGRDVVITAHGHRRLFPRFTGSIEAYPLRRTTQLEFAGTYEIPAGPAGSVIDAVVLGHLAEATLTDLFGVAMQHLDQCAANARDA